MWLKTSYSTQNRPLCIYKGEIMFTLIDLPFNLFTIVIIGLITVSVVMFFREEKKNPGNPLTKMLLVTIPLWVLFFLKKYADGTTAVSQRFSDIIDTILIIYAVLYLVSLAIAWWISYKRGYVDKERLKSVMPLVKTCAIVVATCAVAIVILMLV